MATNLTQIESRDPFEPSLDARLQRVQWAQAVSARRALLLFDGWKDGGAEDPLRRLVSSWEPWRLDVRAQTSPDDPVGRHWLARFWESTPSAGRTTLQLGSWNRALVDQRLSGSIDDRLWSRRCDEINEFESQQRDDGTVLVKLFFDVSAATQAFRRAERERDAWRRHLPTTTGDWPRDAEQAAWSDLFERTDTRWAPWTLIDANDRELAERAALTAVAEALEKALPNEPPPIETSAAPDTGSR